MFPSINPDSSGNRRTLWRHVKRGGTGKTRGTKRNKKRKEEETECGREMHTREKRKEQGVGKMKSERRLLHRRRYENREKLNKSHDETAEAVRRSGEYNTASTFGKGIAGQGKGF